MQYRPLKSVAELMQWEPDGKHGPPRVPVVPLRAVQPTKTWRLHVCHDMAGGYLDGLDKQVQGEGVDWKTSPDKQAPFHLRTWSVIDSFCYFSHHRVVIPPASWISAAHRHGTLCLGTFITEGELGTAECRELFTDVDSSARKLAQIAQYYGFDGWLLNVENPLDGRSGAVSIGQFTLRLRDYSRELVGPHSCVLWYDSVTTEGTLKWQNRLTEHNAFFFCMADGIFINYFWCKGSPAHSAFLAEQRNLDVYTGIDVWGRNTYGGGGFKCIDALTEIAKQTSVALFAPGWVYESQDSKRYLELDAQFWAQFTGQFEPRRLTYADPALFSTSFDLGYGTSLYLEGKQVSTLPWVNIGFQGPLPAICKIEGDMQCSLETSVPAFNGSTAMVLKGNAAGAFGLYLISMPVKSSLAARLVFQSVGGPATVQLLLHVQQGGKDTVLVFPNEPTPAAAGDWSVAAGVLATEAGAEVTAIDIKCTALTEAPADVHVGQIMVCGEGLQELPPVKEIPVKTQGVHISQGGLLDADLDWSAAGLPAGTAFLVYLNGQFVARTHNTCYTFRESQLPHTLAASAGSSQAFTVFAKSF
jgi:mannosyl-glycoprotein endo-beta-N-acetylglucosaminidase